MWTVPRIIAAGLTLAACAPLAIYYRPGVSVSRLESDTLACEVRALRDAPVANQIRHRPPVFIPGARICNADGTCYERPGRWVSGGIYTVDVNAGLRQRVQDTCMAAKGYRPVSLPRCSAAVARSAPPAVTSVLPGLREDSCAIFNDDGSWQIVTPAPIPAPILAPILAQ